LSWLFREQARSHIGLAVATFFVLENDPGGSEPARVSDLPSDIKFRQVIIARKLALPGFQDQKIAAFGSSYSNRAGAAEGCDFFDSSGDG
jgi:hypothetical protein